MRAKQILYWLTTAILCGIMLYSASMYFIQTDLVKAYFTALNYPSYIVIPLAILKVLGVLMVLWRQSKWFTEWSYAGFFFNLVLATAAHYCAGDGIIGFSLFGLIVIFPSYVLGKYLRD